MKILVVQTAFIGDAVLTLPMVQVLHKNYPDSTIDLLAIPRTAELFLNHPDVHKIISYDKRKSDRGVFGLIRMSQKICENRYDIAIIPHRSFRSAFLIRLAGIPRRIGFDISGGSFSMTETVRYDKQIHEIERNLSLLKNLGIEISSRVLPELYPSTEDKKNVDELLSGKNIKSSDRLIAIAPGSVWATKRWLPERYAELIRLLSNDGFVPVLIGGKEDRILCESIAKESDARTLVLAGDLSLLQSAEVLRRALVLVTNDTAPMHLAVAMRIPVVTIFGPTAPSFGFAPYGENDVVVETLGLSCRPCRIHGSKRCPVKTFDCMKRIEVKRVFEEVVKRIK